MDQQPESGKTSLLQKYDIPIDHLSYEYVEKCNDIKELERIVRILRSGEEGDYPQLTESAEKRLAQFAPQSRALRKEEPLLTKSELGAQRWQELSNEMEEWTEEMKSREQELQKVADECQPKFQLPGVRKSKAKMTKTDTATKTTKEQTKPKTKSAVPRDYADWEKFDADKEILRMEVEEERRKEEAERMKKQLEKEKKKKELKQSSKEVLSKAAVAGQLSVTERKFMATQEKDKGNEYYNDGKYEEAVEHYSTSISLDPMPVTYNNRAMAYLKMNNFGAALADCNEVLKSEPLNVKALLRRGMAYKNKENFPKALDDFHKVVELEPANQQAKSLLLQMEEKCKAKLKSIRMAIQDENSPAAAASFPLPSPSKNIRLNEWGLATRMCSCGGVPSWVCRPPPKCKVCAERKAKKEQDESESVEMCSDCNGSGDVEVRDEGGAVSGTDRSGSGDSKKPKDSKLLRRKVTSEAEVNDPVKQMRVQVADKYKKTVRKAGEESRHVEMCAGASPMMWRELQNICLPFEFLKEWQSIKVDSDLSAHARVLRAVKPSDLNNVIGNKLDGPMLSLILACLDRHFVTTDAKLALEYLQCLSDLPRFSIISMFLEPPEKQVVWSLFEKLENQGHHPPAALKKAFSSNNY